MTRKQLSFDAWVELLSYVDVNDRLNCRLVSREIKRSADASLRSITHLRMVRIYGWEIDTPPYFEDLFLSKPFIEVVAPRYHEERDMFFSFIGKFCPNLQVIDAFDYSFTLENLSKVAANLQYFRSYTVCLPLEFNEETLQSDFSPFEHLQAFDIDVEWVNASLTMSFNRHLLKRNLPILRIIASKDAPTDDETCKLMLRKTVSSLHLHVWKTNEKINDLFLDFLAENLVEISLERLSIYVLGRRHFPNLLYLKIKYDSNIPAAITELPSCPNLRRFHHECHHEFHQECITSSDDRLLTWLSLQEKLKTIRLDHRSRDKQLVKFAPPPNLERLIVENKIHADRSLKLDSTSESMKFLICHGFSICEFELTNLKIFNAINNILTVELIDSLSKCLKLQTLELFTNEAEVLNLQSLIDHFAKLSCLEHVDIKIKGPSYHDQTIVTLKQEYFPKVNTFNLKVPFELTFFPMDGNTITLFDHSFTSLYLNNKGCTEDVTYHIIEIRKRRKLKD